MAYNEYGPVILCSGGFGADFGSDSLLAKYRPDLLHLPTTNGEHCTGDGIKMGERINAKTIDLEWVQVHPTGLVKIDDADAKVKFLAAEALRGVGGVLIDKNGMRFCNELGRRDYVSGMMWKNQPPFRLCLNSKASKEIHWPCEHYKGRGVMKGYKNMQALCDETGIKPDVLKKTLADHTEIGGKQEANENGGSYDAYPSGKHVRPVGQEVLPQPADHVRGRVQHRDRHADHPLLHGRAGDLREGRGREQRWRCDRGSVRGGRDRGWCARQQPPRRQLAARLRGLRPRDGPLLRGVDVRCGRPLPPVPEGGVDCLPSMRRVPEPERSAARDAREGRGDASAIVLMC